tara:strand:- start:31225 stop:31713 length:489 start_codon:yes stop_codon:yes gene_type:complete
MRDWWEYKKRQLNTIIFFVLLVIFLLLFSNFVFTDEMVFKFKSPSFSGFNTSQHYLTIENQEHTRKKTLLEEIKALAEELEREENNTTLSRFIRNLESRVYAQLSRQLVENLFGETASKEGSIELEGNTIEYESDDETITLTITDEEGHVTVITFPINSFTF